MLDVFCRFLSSAVSKIVVGLRRVGFKSLRGPNRATASSPAPPALSTSALLMHHDPLAPLSERTPSRYKDLKSLDSRQSIHLRFKNTLDESVKIYWIGYDVRNLAPHHLAVSLCPPRIP